MSYIDASKAFDIVDHYTYYSKSCWLETCLFLLSDFACLSAVCWAGHVSQKFAVTNSGSLLSPILFTVYIDILITQLNDSGRECYWGSSLLVLCFTQVT